MIALVKHKDLSLVGQAAKCGGMDDPVAVAPKCVAGATDGLRVEPAAAISRIGRIGSARDERFDRHAPSASRLTLARRVLNYPLSGLAIARLPLRHVAGPAATEDYRGLMRWKT